MEKAQHQETYWIIYNTFYFNTLPIIMLSNNIKTLLGYSELVSDLLFIYYYTNLQRYKGKIKYLKSPLQGRLQGSTMPIQYI